MSAFDYKALRQLPLKVKQVARCMANSSQIAMDCSSNFAPEMSATTRAEIAAPSNKLANLELNSRFAGKPQNHCCDRSLSFTYGTDQTAPRQRTLARLGFIFSIMPTRVCPLFSKPTASPSLNFAFAA